MIDKFLILRPLSKERDSIDMIAVGMKITLFKKEMTDILESGKSKSINKITEVLNKFSKNEKLLQFMEKLDSNTNVFFTEKNNKFIAKESIKNFLLNIDKYLDNPISFILHWEEIKENIEVVENTCDALLGVTYQGDNYIIKKSSSIIDKTLVHLMLNGGGEIFKQKTRVNGEIFGTFQKINPEKYGIENKKQVESDNKGPFKVDFFSLIDESFHGRKKGKKKNETENNGKTKLNDVDHAEKNELPHIKDDISKIEEDLIEPPIYFPGEEELDEEVINFI